MKNGVDMEVKVFFRQGWFTCGRTKEYLSQNNIDYIPMDVAKDPQALKELDDLGLKVIPVTTITLAPGTKSLKGPVSLLNGANSGLYPNISSWKPVAEL